MVKMLSFMLYFTTIEKKTFLNWRFEQGEESWVRIMQDIIDFY